MVSIRKTPGKGGSTHFRRYDALVSEIETHALDELNLLISRQTSDGRLKDGAEVDLVQGDEGVVVHVRKEAHDKLAIHAVGNATVARNRVAKVLDLESTLQARGEEAAKGSDERRKGSEVEGVKLYRSNSDGEVGLLRKEKEVGHVVSLGVEHRVGVALESCKDGGTKILNFRLESTLQKRALGVLH